MLVGTDAGNLGTIQGYSVHREMIRLVEAGLSPWEALAATTTSAGRFLGQRFGVRPGNDATFVIMEESPIADIENSQDVAMVVLDGRVVFRQ
jgi:imidazolonepropionase-like amidohydrolase